MKMSAKRFRISSFQIMILGFSGIILLGALLLMLPLSSKSGVSTPFLDCLFTSTSATCVTGLIVHDTATYWSGFGQGVILCLIQIGGLGIITIFLVAFMISGKKIGLAERTAMQNAISAPKVGGIVRLTKFLIRLVLVFEAAGALLLMPAMISRFGIGPGIWRSVFHSISAFCNAGFDLMGTVQEYSSLTAFSGDVLVNTVIMALIIIGGIGFVVWDDIRTNKLHFKKYKLQTKMVLTTSLLLIVIPAVYFFFFEFNQLSFGERILQSLFQSVTTRTAGFNTADFSAMSEAGILVMIPLMLIGGSPGSTAGGLKTTTAAILILSIRAIFKRKDSVEVYGRRVSYSVIISATSLLVAYVSLFLISAVIISRIEGLPILTTMFETASAVGTVGLTLGITPSLGTASRIILIALMFFGRMGGLTMIYATYSTKARYASSYPQEDPAIG